MLTHSYPLLVKSAKDTLEYSHTWITINQVGMTDFGQHSEAVMDEAKGVPVKAQAVVHPLGHTPGE